jgi:hypothetical protein
MAYTKPYSFATGDVIDASKVQDNNEALQKYVNGGIAGGDFASNWVEAKHVMKGLYFPLTNHYEMESCESYGMPDYPIYHLGYFGKQNFEIGGSGRADVPTAGLVIHLKAAATVFMSFTYSPRPLGPGAAGAANQAVIGLRVDGSAVNSMQNQFPEQVAMSTDGAIPGPYRRRTHRFQYLTEMTAGDHTIELVGQSGVISVPIKFYNYSIQAFY